MIKTNIFSEGEAHKITDKLGCFSVLEYTKDISVSPEMAAREFFASQMNVKKKQLIAEIHNSIGVIVQAGEMQLMMGNIKAETNIKSAGDLVKKFVGSKVTGETAIKPRYTGEGILVLEPTFKYIILEDIDNWNGGIVIEDGMFLACDGTVHMKVTSRTNISSAVLGNEGLFNTMLTGKGIVALESPVPKEELITVELQDDVLKIDGSMAIAWSDSLEFTVERTTATFIGSVAAGEGLVNVYRGTGKVLIAPVAEFKRFGKNEK